MASLPRTAVLRGGGLLPVVGLGVYKASPAETEAAVASALRLGYRHVDTAQVRRDALSCSLHRASGALAVRCRACFCTCTALTLLPPCSQVYGNEAEVGRAVAAFEAESTERVFITTKVRVEGGDAFQLGC